MTEPSSTRRGRLPPTRRAQGAQGKAGPSLVALLAGVLFVELWLNRIFAQLALREPDLSPLRQRIDLAALFTFELASVLATSLLLLGLGRVIVDPRARGPVRLCYALVGGVVATIAFAGVWVRLPVRFAAHLHTSAIFLLVVLCLVTVSTSSSRRLRAGIVALAVPVALVSLANLVQRFSSSGIVDPRASLLAEAAGIAFVVVGLAAPFLFVPSGPRGPLAPMLGSFVAVLGALLARLDGALTSRLATIGVGVNVPIERWGLLLGVLAASGYAYAVGGLLWSRGPDRLRGLGLLIVCLVGLQLELPYQIAGSLVGFLCLVESATRPGPGAITRAALDELLRRWAALLGARQVTIVGEDGREHARVEFDLDGMPGQLRVERQASSITRAEMSIGTPEGRRPAVTIAARDARSLGPSAGGTTVETGDTTFDARYVVRDARGASTTLLDDTKRVRIARYADGWIGVWPQRGARFVGRDVPRGDDALPALGQLLRDLSR